MPRLILLNGPPGCGKSTLARNHADARPGTFNLDIDVIKSLISGNDGLLARAAALAAARVHLLAGHDVVVPQYLGRVEFIEQLEALARDVGAEWHEVVVLEHAYDRFVARADPTKNVDEAKYEVMFERLRDVVAQRKPTVFKTIGEVELPG